MYLNDLLSNEAEAENLFLVSKAMLSTAQAKDDVNGMHKAIRTAAKSLDTKRGWVELRGEHTGDLKRGGVNVLALTQIAQVAAALPRAIEAQVVEAQPVVDVESAD